jgi:hypothetical protein
MAPPRRLLLGWIAVAGMAALAGCGGADGGGGGGGATSPATAATTATTATAAGGGAVARPAGLRGEAAAAADTVVKVLEEASGEDACYEWLGSAYVESLGGQEDCARRFDPLVTGPYDRITSMRVTRPGRSAVAQVTGSGAGGPVTLRLALATTGWRVNGASGLPAE